MQLLKYQNICVVTRRTAEIDGERKRAGARRVRCLHHDNLTTVVLVVVVVVEVKVVIVVVVAVVCVCVVSFEMINEGRILTHNDVVGGIYTLCFLPCPFLCAVLRVAMRFFASARN